jgi:Ni/Co efflux regulator RcnB
MRKLALIVAAVAAVATAAPAMAQSVTLRVGDHGYRHHRHERVVVRHDRGWHRGWERHHHHSWRHNRHGARIVIR